MPTVITVSQLKKCYRLGGTSHNTLRDQIAMWFRSSSRTEQREFMALDGVDLSIDGGEVVGLIGRNGAGKSTLLKVLSQITEPTAGEVRIRGRVASLLEVGTGFHPELTGRENVFLNGAILGMSRAEILRRFDEIVAFSEVEAFLDTPVKHYSSGMQMKLAFAVAAHLEAEIMLVDEVLAVGDGAFQKKCLGKMGEVTEHGRTIIFVSHSMVAMQALCKRVVWLNAGKIIEDGPAATVITKYLHSTSAPRTARTWEPADAPGNDIVRIRSASIRPRNGTPIDPLGMTTPLVLDIEYDNLREDSHLHLSLHVLTEQGVCVFAVNTVREPNWHGRPFPVGRFRSTCELPAEFLNSGTFRVSLRIVKDKNQVQATVDDLLVFEVMDDLPEMRAGWFGKWPGVVRPSLPWNTEKIVP